ncbi:hypothetical protein [Rufibacter roseus]|uniref:VCBS repeat-containing protein n=1 Tax=Rufibacter roseus TaxID=1567108 RepID=A0ABW2DPF5_9BACT|nr:hypothetical protein [Rufibacter roseus]
MKYSTKISLFLLCFFAANLGYAQADIEIPPKVAEVLEFLQNKEATKAKGEVQKIRPVSWQVFDIDKDGKEEVFLQFVPLYAQSPTISIFQRTKDGTITKLLEGLAPGKIVGLTGNDNFLDTHTSGTAKDIPLSSETSARHKALADSAHRFGLHVVLFKNYAHTDTRRTLNSLVDLTHLDTDRTECGDFKFPQPDQIAAGKMAGQKYNFFVAKVDDQLYCYEIRRFSKRGFIEKTVTVVPLPEEFLQLEIVKDQIKYRTKDDKVKPFKI